MCWRFDGESFVMKVKVMLLKTEKSFVSMRCVSGTTSQLVVCISGNASSLGE